MGLSLSEYKRAKSLQRRLKLLRLWLRIGKFLYKPWSCLEGKYETWRTELTYYYDKMRGANKRNAKPDIAYTKEDIEFAQRQYFGLVKQFQKILNRFDRN